MKLDTVDPDFIRHVDRPAGTYDVNAIVERMKAFHGHVIIQTMFLKGPGIDNTTDAYVTPWLEAVKDIAPRQVMIYTIDRETPVASLRKATPEVLDGIAEQVRGLGLACSVAY